jgi:DNA-binding MarR family transcriptional regulator
VTVPDAFEFMRLLWALDHALQTRSKRMLATVGVTGPQRLVLRAVGRNPGISAGEVAAVLHLHPSTLTGVLSRLVERGLLLRAGDPLDSRRALFRLTARGRKADRLDHGTVESAIQRVLAREPRSRVAAAARVLAAIGTELTDTRRP